MVVAEVEQMQRGLQAEAEAELVTMEAVEVKLDQLRTTRKRGVAEAVVQVMRQVLRVAPQQVQVSRLVTTPTMHTKVERVSVQVP
jgi:hypothetical protein